MSGATIVINAMWQFYRGINSLAQPAKWLGKRLGVGSLFSRAERRAFPILPPPLARMVTRRD